MIIHIPVCELEEPFCSQSFLMTRLYNVGIDYADQTVSGSFEEQEKIIYNFKDIGFVHDNRFNNYELSVGMAGLTFTITKTRI
jgi:hypothetical protein